MHLGCYYATALDIEVDPQRCCFGSRQSYFALQAFVSVYFVVTYSSTGPRKRFREMIAAHGGGHGKGFPARSYPELFRFTGPLLSLVFRTEDVWQRYNQFIETFQSSQSGFPLLTPTMQTGQDSDGGVGVLEGMCTMHAVTMLWFWH